MTDLNCRLLIPQDHFTHLQILEKSDGFTVTWYKSFHKIYDQVPIKIHYQQTTHLPMMHAYKIIYITAESLPMLLCVTIEKNQNLT